MPFKATGCPSSKRTVTSSRLTATSSRQNATPMIGSTIVMPVSSRSRSLASCVAPSMFESVEYAFSALIWYAKPGGAHVLGHLGASAELVDELSDRATACRSGGSGLASSP